MAVMVARARSIVVGYSGSAASKHALDVAAALMGYGSTLTVVSVGAPGSEMTAARLADAHERLTEQHVLATYLQRIGEPVEQLVSAVRALDAQLLVVGRGRDTAPPAASVSAAMVYAAPCDLLVVSEPALTPP